MLDRVGVQVDLGELLDDQVETVGLVELLDLASKPKYSMISRARELKLAMYCCRFGAMLLGSPVSLGKSRRLVLWNALAGDAVEDGLGVLDRAVLELLAPGEHLGLGGFEDAVEAAQNRERQDDLAVLGRLVGAAQEVGHRPDEADLVGEAVHDHSLPRPSGIAYPLARCSDSIGS